MRFSLEHQLKSEGRVRVVTEKDDALNELGAVDALNALRWAHRTAYSTVMNAYDPDTGHDQGWVGYTGYKLMCDRLDRVFSCKKYAVKSETDAAAGLDVVALGLTDPKDIDTMPRLKPGSVIRHDVNGSAGWRCGRWTFITASFAFGGIDRIAWPTKSPTKQRVASQGNPEQLTLPFEEFGLGEAFERVMEALQPEGPVLILAHAIDTFTSEGELYLGRSAFNLRGTEPWFWKENLLKGSSPASGVRPIDPKMPTGPIANNVKDADVRLRHGKAEKGNSSTIG